MTWLQRFLRSLGGEASRRDRARKRGRKAKVKTQLSATVFSGRPKHWVDYLNTPRSARYLEDLKVRIVVDADERYLAFQPENETSRALADCLTDAFATARHKARVKPYVAAAMDGLSFGNPSNRGAPLHLATSSQLPTDATREAAFDGTANPEQTTIVLLRSLTDTVLPEWYARRDSATPEQRLGIAWPILFRVLGQLGYPNYPRDRFVEKIHLMERVALVTLNLLYEGRVDGRLLANESGALYERHVSMRDGVTEDRLFERNTWFRMLDELGFMLEERRYHDYADFAKSLVRDYLDDRYLRLGLSGVMPDLTEFLAPMALKWKRKKNSVSTPPPVVGCYGIVDDEDLAAWKKVHGPFDEMGFTLIRQLGIGQFGRVYEALNRFNPNVPRRVAIKVDRIAKGTKKQAIQRADVTMRVGRDLAAAPHVIRIFDAGKLKGKRYTYHVLQLVDGDTLDNLTGITGVEHASMHRPDAARQSEQYVRDQYLASMSLSHGELWRRQRLGLTFTDDLTLSQVLDLLTSILLWLEEIHSLGYAINDLKNGNLMLSRRGQLKGIDLDSYGPIFSPVDRVTDFYFLAVSLTLFLLNVTARDNELRIVGEQLLQDHGRLREAIEGAWPFDDVGRLSGNRVEKADVVELLVDLIHRSRDRTYAHEPEQFSADIDRLIYLKRSIFLEEIVLD